jgi:serine/threonine protein kinase
LVTAAPVGLSAGLNLASPPSPLPSRCAMAASVHAPLPRANGARERSSSTSMPLSRDTAAVFLRHGLRDPMIPDVGKEGTRSGSTGIGSSIAGFRVARLIGSGALGRVFEVYSPKDERLAIKLLRSKYRALGERLLTQARQLMQVDAPHVVRVHDAAVFSGAPYVVMDIVDGDDLRTRLKGGPLRSAEALAIAREAALGLQALWAHGLAHGDVRPSNLLLGAHGVQVVDALLAPPVAGTDGVRGAPEYLAPECMLGTPPDALTDIYALGCTLFEMLAGERPYSGTPAEVLHAHATAPLPSLATAPSTLDLVTRMLAKDRSLRAKTWSEVIDGIDRALAGAQQPPPQLAPIPSVEIAFEVNDTDPHGDDVRTAEVPAFLGDDVAPAAPPPAPRPAQPAPSAPSTVPVAPMQFSPPLPAPSRVPVVPVIPVAPMGADLPELDEQHTVVRPMTRPIPSAEDIGLQLDPIDDE